MKQPSRLPRSILYSIGGQATYMLGQLGVLSVLAHTKGAAEVGLFGLVLAVATPFFAFSDLGLRTAQAVDITGRFPFPVYASVRILLTGVAFGLSLALGWFVIGGPAGFGFLIVVVSSKVFESISNLSYGAFQQANRMDLVFTSFLIRGGLGFAAVWGLLQSGSSAALALFGQMAVWALVAVVADYPSASRLTVGRLVRPRWDRDLSWKLLKHAAPFGGGLLANALQISIPRMFVERMLGMHALGLFTAVGYFLQAGLLASESISHAIINQLARHHQGGRSGHARKLLLRLFAIMLVCCGLGLAFLYHLGKPMLVLLFGQEYGSADLLLIIVAVSLSIRVLTAVPQCLLYASQRYKTFLLTQLAALLFTLLCAPILIWEWELLGAGCVLIAVAVLRLLLIGFALSTWSTRPKVDPIGRMP